MRKVNIIILALVVIYLLAAPLALGQGEKTGKAKGGNAEEQIAAVIEQVRQADLKGDTSFMNDHFADDYTAIYASGKLYTKAQDIERIKSDDVKYDALDVRDRQMRVYGNTAVVILLISAKGTSSGKPFSGDFRSTWIFVKQKGNWKKVAFQATRVAPASQ